MAGKEEKAEGKPAKGGGKNRLVMIVVLAIGIVGGVKGFVLGGGKAAAQAGPPRPRPRRRAPSSAWSRSRSTSPAAGS